MNSDQMPNFFSLVNVNYSFFTGNIRSKISGKKEIVYKTKQLAKNHPIWSPCTPPDKLLFILTREYQRGKYHCTFDLLFDWFGLVCFANKNKNCQLAYS
jgi:hypothetical protein